MIEKQLCCLPENLPERLQKFIVPKSQKPGVVVRGYLFSVFIPIRLDYITAWCFVGREGVIVGNARGCPIQGSIAKVNENKRLKWCSRITGPLILT